MKVVLPLGLHRGSHLQQGGASASAPCSPEGSPELGACTPAPGKLSSEPAGPVHREKAADSPARFGAERAELGYGFGCVAAR